MVDLTLLELHLDDASFTANAPFTGDDEEAGAADEGMGSGPSRLLLAMIGLGIAGFAGWWLRQGRMPDIDEEIEVTP